jgi:predicted alpha-1,2-mannosidase
MTGKRMSLLARARLAIAVIVTSLAMAGWPGATAARASAVNAAPTPAGVCSKTAAGTVVNCPHPVRRGLLPAAARSTSTVVSPVTDPATYLDTRTWTSGGGNTFPGADYPFGMVQWSPDTLPDRSDGGGYTFSNTLLDGYSLTHLSGPGCRAAGDVPILPMTGKLPGGDPLNERTHFSHYGEVAHAGYYWAASNEPNTITSAFTATAHSAIGQFTFPRTYNADFLIKLLGSERGDTASSALIVSNTEIQGSVTTGDFCDETSADGPQMYTLYFDIDFSQPFRAHQVLRAAGSKNPSSIFLSFSTRSDPVIDAKVGISYVSAADAALNWQTEQPGFNFGAVRAAAQAKWNSLLGEVSVWGGSQARTQEFYSLLYKSLLQPNIVSDVNGRYLGSDFQVHTLAAGQANQYSLFSGWDMYHSQAQLVAMLDPPAASDMAQSLVNYYAQNGILPQWGYLNTDNYIQVGDPSDAVIADYYAFGATGFDTATALADMLKQAGNVGRVRPGEALEAKYGFLPANASYGCCHAHDQVASLLEYDTADSALSMFAAALGDTADATSLATRANNWQNVFNPRTGLLALRNSSGSGAGSFVSGVLPTTQRGYVEGDAYMYLWDVPNNYAGLFAKLGGNAKVVPALTRYLSWPDGRGVHAELSNEFDLGEQNALDYAGDPAGTQQAVSKVRNELYQPGPYGMPNNDDLGSESSQFIWEMLGMYPENPGSGNLVFASPGFPHAVITLPSAKTITISAPGASTTRFYVASLSVNGTADSQLYVPFSTLAQGATLDWNLVSSPTTWGSGAGDAPPSYPSP